MDAELVEPAAVAAIDAAAMFFLPGGSPGRLLTTLSRPALRDALQRLLGRGGVLAGASAGAMVLAELTLLPERGCTGVVVRDGRWHPVGAGTPVLLRAGGHANLDSVVPAPVWRDTSP